MKNIFLPLFCSTVLALSCTAGATGFSDIDNNSWYASEVSDACNAGLMNGIGGGLFSPETGVTVAEAVTLASRINASNSGKTIGTSDGEWYEPYFNYAEENGIIKKGEYSNYD